MDRYSYWYRVPFVRYCGTLLLIYKRMRTRKNDKHNPLFMIYHRYLELIKEARDNGDWDTVKLYEKKAKEVFEMIRRADTY